MFRESDTQMASTDAKRGPKSQTLDLWSNGYPHFPQVSTGGCAQGDVGNFLPVVFAFSVGASREPESAFVQLDVAAEGGVPGESS